MANNDLATVGSSDMMPQKPGEKLSINLEITPTGRKVAKAEKNDGHKKSVVQYSNGRTVTTESIPPSET